MSKDYRHCRAGLPDLVVWNTSENTYKVRSHHTPVQHQQNGVKSEETYLFVAAGGGKRPH